MRKQLASMPPENEDGVHLHQAAVQRREPGPFTSSEAFTGRTTVTSTTAGKPEKTTIEGTGKWLAADCGDVQPPPSAAA